MTRERQMVRGWSIPDPNTCLLLMKWGGDTHPRAMHRAPSATVACCLDIPSHPAPLCPQPHGVATFLGSPPLCHAGWDVARRFGLKRCSVLSLAKGVPGAIKIPSRLLSVSGH